MMDRRLPSTFVLCYSLGRSSLLASLLLRPGDVLGARLARRQHDDVRHLHVLGLQQRVHDSVGHVLRGEGFKPPVHVVCEGATPVVATEPMREVESALAVAAILRSHRTAPALARSPLYRTTLNSVRTAPGQMEVTRTSESTRSWRAAFVKACSACFVAQ